jgi:ABC-type glycerol-3-phosphate transport system permease component
MGYASAMGMVLFVMILIFTLLQWRVNRRSRTWHEGSVMIAGTSRGALTGRLETTGIWLLLVAGAGIMFFPVYWMFATAVRPKDEVFSGAAGLIPSSFVWQNFTDAIGRVPFLSWTANSLIITVFAVVITVTINLLCGYAFAQVPLPPAATSSSWRCCRH